LRRLIENDKDNDEYFSPSQYMCNDVWKNKKDYSVYKVYG